MEGLLELSAGKMEIRYGRKPGWKHEPGSDRLQVSEEIKKDEQEKSQMADCR